MMTRMTKDKMQWRHTVPSVLLLLLQSSPVCSWHVPHQPCSDTCRAGLVLNAFHRTTPLSTASK